MSTSSRRRASTSLTARMLDYMRPSCGTMRSSSDSTAGSVVTSMTLHTPEAKALTSMYRPNTFDNVTVPPK